MTKPLAPLIAVAALGLMGAGPAPANSNTLGSTSKSVAVETLTLICPPEQGACEPIDYGFPRTLYRTHEECETDRLKWAWKVDLGGGRGGRLICALTWLPEDDVPPEYRR